MLLLGRFPLKIGMLLFEFITASGGWDWGHFEFLLLDHVQQKIVVILPPRGDVQDSLAWMHSKDNKFSLNSCYNNIMSEN